MLLLFDTIPILIWELSCFNQIYVRFYDQTQHACMHTEWGPPDSGESRSPCTLYACFVYKPLNTRTAKVLCFFGSMNLHISSSDTGANLLCTKGTGSSFSVHFLWCFQARVVMQCSIGAAGDNDACCHHRGRPRRY